jgi:hypothetical protein
MPFGEALFWVGITAVSIGGFILVDKHLGPVWAWILTVVGLLAIGYSVYHKQFPGSPNPPTLWVLLLLLTWAALGYSIYDRRRHGKTPIPDTATPDTRDQTLESQKAEINKLHDTLEQCRTFANRKALEADENGSRLSVWQYAYDSVWSLKAGAREIRRHWPSADFLDRPANRDLWINVRPRPTVNAEIDDRSWLESAIRWHDSFSSSAATKGADLAYLKSLNFDELMEFLDFQERETRKLPVPVKTASRESPSVGIVRFGEKDQQYGSFVKNYSQAADFSVRIPSFRVGRYRFSFGDKVNTLTHDQGEAFIEATVREPRSLVQHFTLFDALGELSTCIDDGFVPLTIYVEYKDSMSKRYALRHEVERHVTNRESAFTNVMMRRMEMED